MQIAAGLPNLTHDLNQTRSKTNPNHRVLTQLLAKKLERKVMLPSPVAKAFVSRLGSLGHNPPSTLRLSVQRRNSPILGCRSSGPLEFRLAARP